MKVKAKPVEVTLPTGAVVAITGKNRPFSNDFVPQQVKVVKYEGKDEINLLALCTKESDEPGRIYWCAYTMKGKLISCYTLN